MRNCEDINSVPSSIDDLLPTSNTHDPIKPKDGGPLHKASVIRQPYNGATASSGRIKIIQGMSKFQATKEVNMDNVVMSGDPIICMIEGKAEFSVIKEIYINTKKVNYCESDCLQNAVFNVQVMR